MNEKLYIVMPAYNEEENIMNIVELWHPIVKKIGPDSRLVIVDDGSKDNTFELLMSLKTKFSQCEPLSKPNSGHGATCMFAYYYAANSSADYIFQTDSDGQTCPEEFWQFWENRYKYDFVIGSRKNRQDGLSRIFVTKILKIVIWVVFGEKVKDSNTPFRLMNTNKLKPILEIIPIDFFLSNVAISVLIVKRKEKCLWLPITFRPRQGGINSINLKRIIKIGFKAIADFTIIKNKLKKQNRQ